MSVSFRSKVSRRSLRRALTAWWQGLAPPGLFVASFALLIAIGTLGLRVIPGLHSNARLSTLDALFTMTSAVSVTGLSVVDVSQRLTLLGQAWLLLFIQLGGLGLFTFSSLIIWAMGRKLSLRSELLTASALEDRTRHKALDLARRVVRFSLTLEAAGALVLWPQLVARWDARGVLEGLWDALFLSISAFCNAGFSVYPDSLMRFHDRPLVLLPLTFLVIVGGFGFLAAGEIARWLRQGGPRGRRRLSLHTLCAGVVTAALLAVGFIAFLGFEGRGVLAPLPLLDKMVNAWTLSAMTRTAGFNSVDIAGLTNGGAYLTILLMFIGGSPGSTSGGIKTTTLAVLVAEAVSRIRGRRYVGLFGRSIPAPLVERAGAIALIAFALVSLSVFFLGWAESSQTATLAAERQSFLPILFEAVSALSTVGLSLDFTASIGSVSKLLLVGLMFVGRVGLLAFFSAISLRGSQLRGCRPARENVFIG